MEVTPAKLRRIALDRQGLLKREPFGRGKRATLKAIEQLGYVQIDTISVVERAHNHVLRARVPNYENHHIDKLQREGRIFEYWFHAAAYLPMRDFRFALPRMHAMRSGEERWLRSRDQKLMREVLATVRDTGPLKARDFDDTRRNRGGWWDWKPAKSALEQLFMQGDLMVTGREGFQKIYDLTERVLPADTDMRTPDDREMAQYLLETSIRAHGFADWKSITHLRRGTALRGALKEAIDAACASGTLVTLTLKNGDLVYADPRALAQRAPMAPASVKLLSPFDNAVILRERGQAVFDYNYQIECYVTEAERRFGYFCLPILYKDRFIGRADCKAHRKQGRFEVKALYIEHAPDRRKVDGEVAAALERALWEFAEFNGCQTLEYTAVSPANWQAALGR